MAVGQAECEGSKMLEVRGPDNLYKLILYVSGVNIIFCPAIRCSNAVLPLALICKDFLPFFLAGSGAPLFFFVHFKWTNANMLALMVGVFECDDCGKIAWAGMGYT